jgi:hypothetical protein
MKRSVIGAVIFGASSSAIPRLALGVMTAVWDSRISSNTGILSVYRGKATSTRKHSHSRFTKVSQFCPGSETAATRTVVIQSI